MIYIYRSEEPKRETDHNNELYSTDERIVATADYRCVPERMTLMAYPPTHTYIHTHKLADVNLFRSP
jgi:hypothetical protein